MINSTRLLAVCVLLLASCGGDGGGDVADGPTPPTADAGPDASPVCDQPGQLLCGGVCVDSTSDEANCGACGMACGTNQTCTAGICACEAPFITCGTGCIDPATDVNNCGGCVSAGNGDECLTGTNCISGVCEMCLPPRTVCGNACADLTSDVDHCGACFQDCVPGATCSPVGGTPTCQCPASDPVACPSACSDLTDTLNCGACGNECVPGATCGTLPGGTTGCSCPDAAQVACPDGCTITATDNNNCGACGNVCTDGSTCTSGVCACPIGGEIFCGGADGCVDPSTDLDHCGGCGMNCVDGLEGCTSGVCTCASGIESCPMIGGPTDCHDILADPRDCGLTCTAADGNNCNTDEYCTGGTCACRPELDACAAGCTSTASDPLNCGACGGTICLGGTPNCQDSVCVATCAPGRVNCAVDATCVDTDVDPRHCGGCNNNCNEDEVCVGGNCQAYRSTGDCTACPCARCDEVFGGGGSCCPFGTDPICVDDSACPVL